MLAQHFSSFSLGSALLLAVLVHRYGGLDDDPNARWAARGLLFSLAVLQFCHFEYFQGNPGYTHSALYISALYAVAPSFYFYSRRLLTVTVAYRPIDYLHFSPIIIAPLFSGGRAIPMAFFIGGLYVLWIAYRVYGLRAQRERFRLELLCLGLIFILAMFVVLLGFIVPLLNEATYLEIYAVLIGLIFFVVIYTLLRFPEISIELAEAVQAAYSESTLGQVDCEGKLEELANLMDREKIYSNENLSLALVAERLSLSPHQLSELINTRLHTGFSRYVREIRVAEAKRQLIQEPSASVLSIGLAVGFSSQSNFYAAFKETEGIAPGQFRKNRLG